MGMFGNSAPPPPGWTPPGIGARILNQIGAELTGFDYLGQKRRDAVLNAQLQAQGNFNDALKNALTPQYADGQGPQINPPTVSYAPPTTGDVGSVSLPTPQTQSNSSFNYTPPQQTSPGLTIGDPRLPGIVAAARSPFVNYDIAPLLEVLKANQPDVKYDRGLGYNAKTGAPMGAYHPELDKGMTLTPSGTVANLPGYADAAASVAGATAGAQEQAKAPWTLVDVPTSDGSTVKMPLSIAASVLTKNFTQPAPAAATGASAGAPASPDGAAPGQIGRTPTPAETTLANNRATTQGDLEKSQPASKSALTATDNLIGQYTDQVQKMLGETYDPKTGKWVPTPGAKPLVNDWSAGRLFGHFPALTGQATNLEAALDGIRALISSEKMGEVRQDSQGASNNLRLTQGEIFNIFGNLAGPLHQTQDPEALKGVLRDSVNRLRQSQTTMHNQYDQQYNQIQRPTPGSTQPIPPKPRLPSGASGYRIVGVKRGGQ